MVHHELDTYNEVVSNSPASTMEHHATVLEETPLEKEGMETGSLLDINGTSICIAVSFILFTIIMQKLFYAPISQIREKRKQFIMGIKTEADKASEEAGNLQVGYVEKIAEARKKVGEKTAELIAEANEEKTKILEEKRKDIEQFLAESRAKIQQEQDKSLELLKENVSGYAFEISKKILNEEIPIAGVTSEAIDKAMNG